MKARCSRVHVPVVYLCPKRKCIFGWYPADSPVLMMPTLVDSGFLLNSSVSSTFDLWLESQGVEGV